MKITHYKFGRYTVGNYQIKADSISDGISTIYFTCCGGELAMTCRQHINRRARRGVLRAVKAMNPLYLVDGTFYIGDYVELLEWSIVDRHAKRLAK